ncbi:hypothetical protein BDD12DRAFT_804656 [Trichophaea hybrida]|nr:hypothetical protein BDD12DRAFT_804656 [Trichophaea hybrida]
MDCCGRSRRSEQVLAEHKFAYVNLSDFRSKSCLNYTAYFWIYMGTLISVTCYAADIYTAVILLAYNRWTNDTLERASLINFNVAKIVFSVCIFLSFVLLAIDWFFAIKVIKSDGVAEAYMNVIALRFNCIRGGKSKGDTGWKRFLVFSRLTDSRGVVDYLALFTYFAFKGWVRIIFAEGPRVVINALTFISITQANVIMNNKNDTLEGFQKFGQNIQHLYNQNKYQVVILGTMAFTSIMWIFAILRLLIASLVYICYLWHAMSGSQSLRGYCKDRIDTRMGEIVQKKHDKTIRREKQQNKEFLGRQPTIPILAQEDRVPLARHSADSQSSTANLINTSPSRSMESHITPPPSYMTNREPVLPNRPEPAYSTIRGGAPGQPVGFRQPPPSRSVTRTATSGATQGYREQDPYFNSRGPPQQQPYPEVFDPTLYQQQPMERQRPVVQGGYAGDGGYQMQPLAPPYSGRTPFVADEMARNNGFNGPQPGSQGRFPIRPREPPMAAGQRPGWDGGPRSQTAVPQNRPAYGPPPRSQTVGPTERYGYGYGPPPRSNTAGPIQGGYSAPPRSQTARPIDEGYGAPRDDNYGPPPRSNTAGPMMQGYGAPPPRSQTARPVGRGYGVPRDQTQDSYGPPARSNTAGPMIQGGYNAPLRSQIARPIGEGYGASRDQVVDSYEPPARSNTAGPMVQGYGAPPRSQTAGPVGEGYGVSRSQIQDSYGAPPRSQTAAPITGGYAPPRRVQTAAPSEDGYGPPQRGRQGYEQEPRVYAGKATYQPAQRTQERSQTAGPLARGERQFEPPQRTRTAPLRGEFEEFGPPKRSETAPPRGAVPPEAGGGNGGGVRYELA